MATLWVDNSNGNDSNGGQAPSLAKASISGALTAASDGDRLIILYGTGTYYLRDELTGPPGADSPPLVWSPEDTHVKIQKRVSITGGGFSVDNSDTLASSLTPTLQVSAPTESPSAWVYGPSPDVLGGDIYQYALPFNPRTVFDSTFSGSDTRAIEVTALSSMSQGKMYYDEASGLVYYIFSSDSSPFDSPADPGTQAVRVPTGDCFFSVESDGVHLENLRFTEWGPAAIKSGAFADLKVSNCLFFMGAGPALQLEKTVRPLIERCRIRHVGERAVSSLVLETNANLNKGAVRLDGTSEALVRHNEVASFSGAGVLIYQSGGKNTVVENEISSANYSLTSGAAGITVSNKASIQGAEDYVLRNRLHGSPMFGVYLEDTANVVVGQNTVYDCLSGVVLGKTPLGYSVKNCHIRGNIISETGKSWLAPLRLIDPNSGRGINDAAVLTASLSSVDKANLKTNVWRHNLYHHSPATATGDVPRFRFSERYGDLSWWQGESGGWDSDSSVGSPSFGGATVGDFQIAPNSDGHALVEPFDFLLSSHDKSNIGRRRLGQMEDAGALPLEPRSFDPREDLFVFLTGNAIGENALEGNVDPVLSTGGDRTNTESDPLAHSIDVRQLWDIVDGADINDGGVRYRAIDFVNLALQPLSSAPVGGGSVVENFDSTTGYWTDPKFYLSSLTLSPSTVVAIGWDTEVIGSSPPESPPYFQGPLLNDEVAPSGVSFTSPTTAEEAIFAPLESPTDLTPITPGAGVRPGAMRLWIRRIVSSGATYRNNDQGSITGVGIA